MRELPTHGFHTIKLANYLVQKGKTFLLVAQFFPSYSGGVWKKKYLNPENNAPNNLLLSTHYVLIYIDYFIQVSQILSKSYYSYSIL